MSVTLPPEASHDYAAARLGMINMLAGLAAQEAERGAAALIWENGALAALFGAAAAQYDDALDGRLGAASIAAQPDLALSALGARNADLRRTLIALHEAVEARRDRTLDLEILDLYRRMAHARHLDLPGALSG
jgi:hypothetical protein